MRGEKREGEGSGGPKRPLDTAVMNIIYVCSTLAYIHIWFGEVFVSGMWRKLWEVAWREYNSQQ